MAEVADENEHQNLLGDNDEIAAPPDNNPPPAPAAPGGNYFEVSVDLAAAQIEITRDDNVQFGPLLDHTVPGSNTISLERMWLVGRYVLGSYLLVAGVAMLSVVGLEWSAAVTNCKTPLRGWLMTQAIAQILAVPLSILARRMLGAQRVRGLKEMVVGVSSRLANLFIFSWFIVGMVWIVSSFSVTQQCQEEIPLTWYLALGFLISEIFLLVFATAGLFCSCMIVIARMLIISRGGNIQNIRQRRGATAEEIQDHSEVKRYAPKDFPDEEDRKCVICLGEYEEGDDLRRLGCGHNFHIECVDEWLKRNSTCPLCVRDLQQEGDLGQSQEFLNASGGGIGGNSNVFSNNNNNNNNDNIGDSDEIYDFE